MSIDLWDEQGLIWIKLGEDIVQYVKTGVRRRQHYPATPFEPAQVGEEFITTIELDRNTKWIRVLHGGILKIIY